MRHAREVNRMIRLDSMLAPYSGDIELRCDRYNATRSRILSGLCGDIASFADGYKYFGFHRTDDGWVFREWLPGADAVYLTGDFNGWNCSSHPLTRTEGGVWEIRLDGADSLRHGQHVKLRVCADSTDGERIPAYIRKCSMDENSWRLCGIIWDPPEQFAWTDSRFFRHRRIGTPYIYEAHIGMSQDYEGIGTYREFADKNLPYIASLGYNTVQLMAIQEHPYYASFGYQVSGFFAPSYRFGSPEDLKYLINKAHGLGIHVLLDVVHSHACSNVGEGLNMQDGTEDQYFLSGDRGRHPAWDTRIFNYGKTEVLHFLLSNLKYWVEEFHFDGFRFDGVTSMAFENHALGTAFTDYGMYYSYNTNVDALVYLTLANELVHTLNRNAITVAEDMSGTPGMCLPIGSAGIGFDFRLNMGLPDWWIRFLKDSRPGEWDLGRLWFELTSGRPGEKSISYCESHDQALVGDKTIIMHLAGSEIYTGMEKSHHSPCVDMAVDYHKLIRLITLATCRGGYLCFMGNEFGHPEWIDFPREGNGWSYRFARRQWHLKDDAGLKYDWLLEFDKAMIRFFRSRKGYAGFPAECLEFDQSRSVVCFRRDGLIFVFNFDPEESIPGYTVPAHAVSGNYCKVVFSSDAGSFGGLDRIDTEFVYRLDSDGSFDVYLPCRSAMILEEA